MDDRRRAKAEATEKAMREYYYSVGRVAHAWNYLQETLGRIFVIIIHDVKYNVACSLWHSQQSDRNQRRLLRSSISSGALDDWKHHLPPRAGGDIIWLLFESDELSGRRDEAIHSPVGLRHDDMNIDPVPIWYFGNPLANRLSGKKLIDELSLSEWRAHELDVYSMFIESALRDASTPWPSKRPGLSRELHRQQRRSNLRDYAKQTRTPPLSSQR